MSGLFGMAKMLTTNHVFQFDFINIYIKKTPYLFHGKIDLNEGGD